MPTNGASGGDSSDAEHRFKYKNSALNRQELRRRREEEGVQLRKQKRETELNRRRNLDSEEDQWLSTDECHDNVKELSQVITQEMLDAIQANQTEQLLETQKFKRLFAKDPTEVDLVRNISKCLLRMSCNKDINSLQLAEALMPYWFRLLESNDNEVKANVLHVISIATERDQMNCAQVCDASIRFVHLVTSNATLLTAIMENLTPINHNVVLYAIRIIANIVSWDESFAHIVIQAGILKRFEFLINHQWAYVQKEVVFTISNITAGNVNQIQAVIDAQLIPSIVELLYMADYRTQVETIYVILNISVIGSFQQISYLLNMNESVPYMNIIDAIATMLTSHDALVIETTLKVYNNLLTFAKMAKILTEVVNKCEKSAALYHIESVQIHDNSQIASLAQHIMDNFFTKDSSFEEDIAFDPNIGIGKHIQFSF